MPENATRGSFVIERLLNRESFPHPVAEIRLFETHISWVVLTGPFAYKIKKPVVFEFVDYSTLDLRKTYCLKELQLNRRLAPELYLDIVAIHDEDGRLKVSSREVDSDGQLGSPLEYAVKMRQFPQDAIVASRLNSPELTDEAVDRFGKDVASFHEQIDSAIPTLQCVQVDRIGDDALDNFVILQKGLGDDRRTQTLEELECWTVDEYERIRHVFQQRLHGGLVRRCHGDMHLKNVLQLGDRLIAFDGIEFNEEFQWIDVMSELAFPVMDFVARGRADLGWRLLNSYLEASGDYQGVTVLRFYLVYRALVRAKVTWLNPANRRLAAPTGARATSSADNPLVGPWDKYIATASYFAFDFNPALAITHGFSGSGKSTRALQWIEKHGGIRLRSDVERHRLADRFKTRDKYSAEMNDWVYDYVLQQTRTMIDSGWPVVVDATFLRFDQRRVFQQLAAEMRVEFQILDCEAEFEELCQRILQRGPGPSQATVAVLKTQIESHDPLTTSELQYLRKGEQ